MKDGNPSLLVVSCFFFLVCEGLKENHTPGIFEPGSKCNVHATHVETSLFTCNCC